MVRVNQDTWVLCIFCMITRDACSLPVAQVSGGRRQNIDREGCVGDENDFAPVQITIPHIHLLATEYGVWRHQNETIDEYLFQIRTFLIVNLIRLGS